MLTLSSYVFSKFSSMKPITCRVRTVAVITYFKTVVKAPDR